MTDKLQSPSTQTAIPNQSAFLLKPFSPPISSASIPAPAPTLPLSSAAPASADSGTAIASNDAVPSIPGAAVAKAETDAEEEPYTIKCICGYSGDDGNTIYCEDCDSWQHIECFYPNNADEATREEFSHACHDCMPRPLDAKHAKAYQKQRLEAAQTGSVGNTKPKRPPSKSHSQSHRKRPKPTDLQLGGTAFSGGQRHPSFAHDVVHPPAKKPKSAHRSSQSLGGSHTKRSPSYSASRTNFAHGHPLSPATTPPDLPDGMDGYGYSSDFLSLCNEQGAVQIVQTNSFATLAVSNTISMWLREPEQLWRETERRYNEVFRNLPPGADDANQPPKVEVKKRILGHDPLVRQNYLAATEAVGKDVRLMELNGQVGFQKDYCAVHMNRYEELSSPLPFVFFHPLLPLYIDTRREGSQARFVRRSCRPNAVLDTFLTDGSNYHFWLVSDRRIEADEQITIAWDFRLPHHQNERIYRHLGMADDDGSTTDDTDIDEGDNGIIASLVGRILAEYGGCACDLGMDCSFARLVPNYSQRAHHGRSGHSKKKSARKSKPHTLSPTSTGHATNSRAASEGHLDELTEYEKASIASRSKPPSRDMTPAPRQGSFDTLGILTEPTDRDKRKVAMVEDSFRRLEQQPPRKKKRTSDGTTTLDKSSSNHGKSKSRSSNATGHPSDTNSEHSHLPNGTSGRHYVNTGTSRSKTTSPHSSISPKMRSHEFAPMASGPDAAAANPRQASAGPPPRYCDAAVQTDPTVGEWYSEKPSTPQPRRRVVSLSRRLLSHRHHLRFETCKKETADGQATEPPSTDVGLPVAEDEADVSVPATTPSDRTEADDVPMHGAAEPTLPRPKTPTPTEPSTATPAASDSAATTTATTANAATTATEDQPKKVTNMHLQMPKSPVMSDAAVSPMTAGLSSATSLTQSPLALSSGGSFSSAVNGTNVATPSPAKKKMSLSDYTKSRKAGGRPAVSTPLKPFAAHADDPKSATSADNTGPSDSPTSTGKTDASLVAAASSVAAAGSSE